MNERKINLCVEITGVNLRTPILLASGCCGYGLELLELEGFSWEDVGAIVLKSITLEARSGRPPPRVAETSGGMLNAIGLQNPGVDEFLAKIVPKLDTIPSPIIASIIGETVGEYVQLAKRLEGVSSLRALEVNISSPNIERGGMEFGVDAKAAAQVAEGVRGVWSKPIWMKLSPQAVFIADVAEACVRAGAEAVSLINTIPAMAIDVNQLPPRPVLGANFGGLSGPAIKPVALRKIFEVCRRFQEQSIKAPIIGIGGIWDAKDVLESFAAGASAVQIGTVLFHNPHAASEIVRELKNLLKKAFEQTGDERWLDIHNWQGSLVLN